MKPFDLQKALAGEPVITRKGRKVVRIAHFPEAHEMHRVVALVEGDLIPITHDEGGRNLSYNSTLHDLFMAPKKVTVWVVALSGDESHGTRCGGYFYDTKEEAIDMTNTKSPDYIGVFPVEIEI